MKNILACFSSESGPHQKENVGEITYLLIRLYTLLMPFIISSKFQRNSVIKHRKTLFKVKSLGNKTMLIKSRSHSN